MAESPVAMMADRFNIFEPWDGRSDAYVLVHADGRVVIGGQIRRDLHRTPEQMRQLRASLIFPQDGEDPIIWSLKLRDANRRRAEIRIGFLTEQERGTVT